MTTLGFHAWHTASVDSWQHFFEGQAVNLDSNEQAVGGILNRREAGGKHHWGRPRSYLLCGGRREKCQPYPHTPWELSSHCCWGQEVARGGGAEKKLPVCFPEASGVILLITLPAFGWWFQDVGRRYGHACAAAETSAGAFEGHENTRVAYSSDLDKNIMGCKDPNALE